MKNRICQFLAGSVIAGFLFVSSPSLLAQPVPAANLLRQAYVTLSVADHDYKGHRAAAMKEVEAAAKALRVDLRGDGRGHERQGVSDEQLRLARGLLEQARAGLRGRALRHTDRAINQLNIALRIR